MCRIPKGEKMRTRKRKPHIAYKRIIFLFLIWLITFNRAAKAQPVTYTVTVTAGAGGSVSPSGPVSVNEGEDITFTITPDNGYIVANIHSDSAGVSLGATPNYTYYDVRSDNSLTVIFLPESNSIA